MEEYNDLLIENDKTNAPFLLAASFHGLIKYSGSLIKNGTLYWQFYPREQAIHLINQYRTKTEPHIPARDIFEAIETFWRQVSGARNGEIKYEGKQTT